jgi:hypothetical protein
MASDLVAGVLAAADPSRAAGAQRRLAQASKTGTSFASLAELTVNQSNMPAKGADKTGPGKAKALQQLEGALLANVLETIIPEAGGSLFGDQAGQFWRGEQIRLMADSVSSRSILGIGGDLGHGSDVQSIKAFAFEFPDKKT